MRLITVAFLSDIVACSRTMQFDEYDATLSPGFNPISKSAETRSAIMTYSSLYVTLLVGTFVSPINGSPVSVFRKRPKDAPSREI